MGGKGQQRLTHSYRFDKDFIDFLHTWAFISKKDRGTIIQEAFSAYIKLPENAATLSKVEDIIGSLEDK